MNKIVPNIWLTSKEGKISEIVEYYKNVFGNEFQEELIIPLGATPNGNSEMCEVHIFGQKYSLMTTETEHQPLNDAISFCLYCKDQAEIDKYWDYFTKEGTASQCAWCIDKYGLRWQVLPENFGELMSKPNAFEVMMKQTKIVIAEYFQ